MNFITKYFQKCSFAFNIFLIFLQDHSVNEKKNVQGVECLFYEKEVHVRSFQLTEYLTKVYAKKRLKQLALYTS